MAHATTPHTESGQNQQAGQSDLEPNQLRQDAGRGDDAASQTETAGAQTGMERNPRNTESNLSNAPKHNTEPLDSLPAGTELNATPKEGQTGITNKPAEEAEGQRKVIDGR